uniref:Putative secreted protein n=1 Tax=Xenopsylla cheopis TaxID=163159 RepID=A0A6M2DZQ8_XENCH
MQPLSVCLLIQNSIWCTRLQCQHPLQVSSLYSFQFPDLLPPPNFGSIGNDSSYQAVKHHDPSAKIVFK